MIEKSIASPSASSAYVEPSERPLMHCWTNSWRVTRPARPGTPRRCGHRAGARGRPAPLAQRREGVERALGAGVVVGPGRRRGAQTQVLGDGEPGEDPPALGREPDATADDALGREVADLPSLEFDRARARP